MSIWSRRRPAGEQREVTATNFDLQQLFGGSRGYANIDGSSIEVASQSIAVASAVDLIASLCSELPIDVYSGKGAGRREVQMPGYLEDPAGDGYGLPDWIYQGVYSWLYRGNLFGEILSRNTRGYIQQATLFHPDKVNGWINPDNGEVQWSVSGKEITTSRMLHRRVNPVPGQIKGSSPISRHADQIGVSLAAVRFGKGWFDSDAQPVGILRNQLAAVTPEQSQTVKQRFMAALRGTREPIVMGRGWEFSQLTVNPEESQFLQTMGYSAAECARIFGPGIAEILGYESGGSMTYSNVQDRDISMLKYSLNRWLRRLERLLSDFLPKPQYVVFNRDALLETNTLQRYQAYASALQNQAWKLVDEVREKENLPPLPEPAPELPADPSTDPGLDQQDPNEGGDQ